VTEPRRWHCPLCGKALGVLTPRAEVECRRCGAYLLLLDGVSGLTVMVHCVEANAIASRRN
jgi:DNA-directed RNA polymerase subunit RPC12/RpoP